MFASSFNFIKRKKSVNFMNDSYGIKLTLKQDKRKSEKQQGHCQQG